MLSASPSLGKVNLPPRRDGQHVRHAARLFIYIKVEPYYPNIFMSNRPPYFCQFVVLTMGVTIDHPIAQLLLVVLLADHLYQAT
jgi:hypothetical protein